MTITLIGMPASGKSTVGKLLAKELGIKFIDTDNLIEERTGRHLQDIINSDGLDQFKRIEEDILMTVTEQDAVIATGGSAVYYDRAMEHLKTLGKVVYLKAELKTIVIRLGDFSKRGIALKPGTTIADLYDERIPLYEKYADITVPCDNIGYKRSCHSTVRKIIELVRGGSKTVSQSV